MEHPEGTVTIRLQDYNKIISEQTRALEVQSKIKEVSHELEVFLSYLCYRYGME